MAAPTSTAARAEIHVPASITQVEKLTRYQLREYLRSSRFVIMLAIVLALGSIVTAAAAYFRGGIVAHNLTFYGDIWGNGSNLVLVLAAVIFGGDAIAGEFQNKTGYFLMGLPIRRATVYAGKFIAAFLASLAVLLLFLAILVGNGAYYFGGGFFPWQLALSLTLAVVYLAAVLGATFLFSSLFKTSAYGFVLTAILFIFGFSLIQGVIVALWNIEPWMVISYSETSIAGVFSSGVNWGIHGKLAPGPFGVPTYYAGIAEAIVIMFGYFFLTAIAGLLLFEKEEFS